MFARIRQSVMRACPTISALEKWGRNLHVILISTARPSSDRTWFEESLGCSNEMKSLTIHIHSYPFIAGAAWYVHFQILPTPHYCDSRDAIRLTPSPGAPHSNPSPSNRGTSVRASLRRSLQTSLRLPAIRRASPKEPHHRQHSLFLRPHPRRSLPHP